MSEIPNKRYYLDLPRELQKAAVPENPIRAVFTSNRKEFIIMTNRNNSLGSSVIEGWEMALNQRNWQLTFSMPDDIHNTEPARYAAYDSTTDMVAMTFEGVMSGIVLVSLSYLRDLADNHVVPVGGHKMTWFVSPFKEKKRSFRGLAMDTQNDILYSCNDMDIYDYGDIGAWDLKTGEFRQDFAIKRPAQFNAFSPSVCALNKKCDTMVVSDLRHSTVYIFKKVPNGARFEFHSVLAKSGGVFNKYKDFGYVVHPDGVSFDDFGNILVVDGGNTVVKIYKKKKGDRFEGVWCSKRIGALPKCAVFSVYGRKAVVLIGCRSQHDKYGLYLSIGPSPGTDGTRERRVSSP